AQVLLRCLGVLQHSFRRLASLAGFFESCVMDHANLLDSFAAIEDVILSPAVQAALVGGFGGVQVSDGGNVFVGMAEIVVRNGFGGSVLDALVVPNRFLVGRYAVRAALPHQDLAEDSDAR